MKGRTESVGPIMKENKIDVRHIIMIIVWLQIVVAKM